jgi:hypothetical protein
MTFRYSDFDIYEALIAEFQLLHPADPETGEINGHAFIQVLTGSAKDCVRLFRLKNSLAVCQISNGSDDQNRGNNDKGADF